MAKKPTITSISSGYASNTQLNANFEALRNAFDNTISRDGSTPNVMTADLDLNSNDILNIASLEVDTLTVGGTAFTFEELSGLGSVAGQFLNPAASEPTTRDDGSALQTGDIYFNTSDSVPYMYSGTTFLALVTSNASVVLDTFSGNSSTVDFTLSTAPSTENFTFVYISGVYQQKSSYSVSGTTLTFSSAPATGTNNIEVITYSGELLASTTTFSNITVTGGSISGANITTPSLQVSKANGETLKLSATDSGTPSNYIGLYDTAGRAGYLGYDSSSNNTLSVVNERNADLRFLTNNSARLTIDNAGLVGIGNTNPSYTLDVTGNINFTGTLYENGVQFKQNATGSVLEELHSLCNTTSLKGRATMQNVTTSQDLTNTYSDITGSIISAYTCPVDTSEIVYEFNYQISSAASWNIGHFRLYYSTNGTSWTEVTKAKTEQSGGQWGAMKYPLRWVFKVNAGSNDSTVGQFSAARPTLYFKWMGRRYASEYTTRLHGTYYWDGSGNNNQFSLPSVCIKAIA